MYVITGATGNIGSKTTGILLAKGEKVRVIGRNGAKLLRFSEKGAEAFVGDLNDRDFLVRAFTGATAVFAMIPPDYTAKDFRAYQNEIGKNIATAVKEAGVRYVVNLSSQGADLPAGTGPILGLHDQEERLNQLEGVNILHLRCTYFMENLLMNIPLMEDKGIAGSAVRGDLKIAMIATRDIAAHVAERLVRRNFEGKQVHDLLGQRDLSLNEAVAIIGRQIGKPDLKYVTFSYEDTAKALTGMGFSSDVSRLFVEMSKAFNDRLIGVNRQRNMENTTPTSMEEFAGTTFARAFAAATTPKAA